MKNQPEYPPNSPLGTSQYHPYFAKLKMLQKAINRVSIALAAEDKVAEKADHLIYQIKIEGELDPIWMAWFECMTLEHDSEGNTVLTGPVVDQTALHSTLLKIRDLNLKLISVNQIALSSGDLLEASP